MKQSIKYLCTALVLCSLALSGCDDMFDQGDTEKVYTGPDVVAFKPQQAEVTEGGSLTMEVQLISSDGLASSDISVSFSVDDSEENTAEPDQYSLSTNSVTIASGTAVAEFTISFPSNSSLAAGEESTLILNITDSSVGIAENLGASTIFISGS